MDKIDEIIKKNKKESIKKDINQNIFLIFLYLLFYYTDLSEYQTIKMFLISLIIVNCFFIMLDLTTIIYYNFKKDK